jgi:hypothetical protein
VDLSQIGLVFDIAGALLLSAEAIKVRNLERLVMRTQAVVSRLVFVQISPEGWAIGLGQRVALPVANESSKQQPALNDDRGLWWRRMKIIGTTLLISVVLGAGLVWLWLLLIARIDAGPIGHSALFALLLLPLGLVSLLFLFALTSSALGTVLLLVEASVAAVAVFERRTADGTVGIVGAFFLIAGFACQFVAAGQHTH